MAEDIRKQYQITVKGKVQRVGFRDQVEDIALAAGLSGYVKNLSHHDVFILVEGDESRLTQFCDAVQRCTPPAKVSSLLITEHPPESHDDFFIIRGDPSEELAERFDSAIHYLHSMDNKQDQMLGKQDQMLGKQDQIIGKQDQMLGKQDQIIDKQDQMLGKQDQMLGKQDQIIDKQDQMITLQKETIVIQSKTCDEIHEMRSDLTGQLMVEVSQVRAEIKGLRDELVQAGILSAGHH
ncbi:MAG TPA: acylphosphatase [Methanospirillum sp.]|nr:acylphosphatase [Methanospirillum sp.]